MPQISPVTSASVQTDLSELLLRRNQIVQSQTDLLTLSGLATASNTLGITPAGHTTINNENIAEWILAANSALPNNFVVEAYTAVIQGELEISNGSAPKFTRDAKRFPPEEVYLSSLKTLLRVLDRQEVETKKSTGEIPYLFDDATWTKDWRTAVDLAVATREEIKLIVEGKSLEIAPGTKNTSIPLSWDDSRIGSSLIDGSGQPILNLKGTLVSSIAFDAKHPWWQASGPMMRVPFNFDKFNFLSSLDSPANPFPVVKARETKSNTLEGVLLDPDKYPVTHETKITLHFVVQPLPLLADEERVLFAPLIPLPKGKTFVDTVTASQVVANKVIADLDQEQKATILVQEGRNVHPFEAVPSENLGTWRSDVAAATSPWIDRNVIVAVKGAIAGKDAELLRDLLKRDIRNLANEEKTNLVGHCLGVRNKNDWNHFLDLLVERELISSDSIPAIKLKAEQVAKAPQRSSIADYFNQDRGFDTFATKSLTRGGGSFGGLHTGAASDISVGTTKRYQGPEIDCDPMGQIDVYLIMPVAINQNEDPQATAMNWLKAFEDASLGN